MSAQFQELFLSQDSLKSIFLHMCKLQLDSADPIIDSLIIMLTRPIVFAVSRYGVNIFKNAAPMPFSSLNGEQRQLIYDMCNSLRSEFHTFSAFACLENPLTYSIENEKIVFNVSVNKIDPRLVILNLIEILKSSKPTNFGLLFNLILQKLHAKVQLSKEIIEFAHLSSSL
jgi:hypothetical protein